MTSEDLILPEDAVKIGHHSYRQNLHPGSTNERVVAYVKIFPDRYTTVYRPNRGISRQVEAVKWWARDNNIVLSEIFYDIAVPSRKLEANLALMDLVERKISISRLVTYSYNNLGYDGEQFRMVVSYFNNHSSYNVVCLDLPNTTNDKPNFLVPTTFLWAAKFFDKMYYDWEDSDIEDEEVVEKATSG